MPHPDYYIVLGVSRNADVNKIKKAYRKVVKKYHPDSSQTENHIEKFREAREAYETLTDNSKRKKYDAALVRQQPSLSSRQTQNTVRQQRSFYNQHIDDMFSLVGDFFEGFVPGFFSKEKSSPPQKDLYLEVILSPLEAKRGGLYPIAVPVTVPCPNCSRTEIWDALFCPECNGFGRITMEREFSLSIPPNTTHGTEIILSMEDIGLRYAGLHVKVFVDPDLDDFR